MFNVFKTLKGGKEILFWLLSVVVLLNVKTWGVC